MASRTKTAKAKKARTPKTRTDSKTYFEKIRGPLEAPRKRATKKEDKTIVAASAAVEAAVGLMVENLETLLKEIRGEISLSDGMKARIDAALKGQPRPTPSPLENIPSFVQRVPSGKSLAIERLSDKERILLGLVDGYEVRLLHYHGIGDRSCDHACLRWGCRTISNEAQARRHWQHGMSTISHDLRPNSAALIDYIAALCRHLGWKW